MKRGYTILTILSSNIRSQILSEIIAPIPFLCSLLFENGVKLALKFFTRIGLSSAGILSVNGFSTKTK